MSRYWVSVLGEAEGLRWVLKNSRMAFTEAMADRAQGISEGDGLVLYAGRGAFHNPTRDESQLVGVARVTSPSRRLRQPIEIAGRGFVVVCDLDIEESLPERSGVPIKPLVSRLKLVKRPEVWGQYFRKGLVEIGQRDFQLLARAVRRSAS
jgi:hypothetical protein